MAVIIAPSKKFGKRTYHQYNEYPIPLKSTAKERAKRLKKTGKLVRIAGTKRGYNIYWANK